MSALPRDLCGRFIGRIDRPGIYDLPAAVYNHEPCAAPSIGSSGLHTILEDCPAVYRHASALNPDRPVFDTEAFVIGRAAHMLLLEPDRFFATVEVLDARVNLRTDRGKAKRGRALRAGKTVLTMARFAEISAMRDAVMAHPFAGNAFADGQAERSLVWRDAETEVWLRCRPDFLPTALRHIPDYKTAKSAKPERFARDAFAYGYHMRAAHYLDGIAAVTGTRPDAYYFVVQEKTPPYLVTCVTLDAVALDWGRIANRKAVHLFAECLAADRWPGYADAVVDLPLPGYAQAELQRADEAGRFSVIRDQGSGIGTPHPEPVEGEPVGAPGGQPIIAAG